MVDIFHFLRSLKSLDRPFSRAPIPDFAAFRRATTTDCKRIAGRRKASIWFVACTGSPQGAAHARETFLRRDDALRWPRLAELSVDRNETPVSSRIGRLTKFSELVRLDIDDMTAVDKPSRRTKAATLDMLRGELGIIKIMALDRERLIQSGHARSRGL